MKWLSLIISLPADQSALRMRAWRTVRAAGAATLRDGAYLLPDTVQAQEAFSQIATDVQAATGTAHVLYVSESYSGQFTPLFDRGEDYRQLLDEIQACARALSAQTLVEARKQVRKLRKSVDALVVIDFFPGPAQQETQDALARLEGQLARLNTPDEPHASSSAIPHCQLADFQGRTWATRARPWVDRLASAWLIRRYIDQSAHILWLAQPVDCPADALGFDFDGATFSHAEGKVTFETLVRAFDLAQPALDKLGRIVHFLDVGGVQPPEATGIEQVLAGMRHTITDDDALLAAASSVFDSLLIAFSQLASEA